jgi:hypothetical protein
MDHSIYVGIAASDVDMTPPNVTPSGPAISGGRVSIHAIPTSYMERTALDKSTRRFREEAAARIAIEAAALSFESN